MQLPQFDKNEMREGGKCVSVGRSGLHSSLLAQDVKHAV